MDFAYLIEQLGHDPGTSEVTCPTCLTAVRRDARVAPSFRPWQLAGVSAVKAYAASLSHEFQEHVLALFVDATCQLLSIETVAVGCSNSVSFKAGPLFCRGAKQKAHGIVLVHNHPSGEAAPSSADVALTRRLAMIAEAFDMTIIDHVIIAGQDCYSFREHGLL